jgi:hypothetical protein
MSRHGVLIVVAWLVVAAATAAVGTAALDIVGAGILGPDSQSLSPQDVTRQLASATPRTSPSAGPSSTSTPTGPSTTQSAAPGPRGLASPGGTIVAQCDRDQVTLVSWSPAQGFRTDDVNRGPASIASIKFKSGRTEIVATITCQAGEPHVDSTADSHR